MDQLIVKNIFTGTGGDYVSKRDVKIIDTTTDDLYDPPVRLSEVRGTRFELGLIAKVEQYPG